MKLRYKSDNEEVFVGDVLEDFRGDKWIAKSWDEAPPPGKSGKIEVVPVDGGMNRSFYVRVFNLYYQEE